MQFIGNDGDQQRRTQEGFDHDFNVIKMLALRVRKMSSQEWEDLYSAMRTIVKMAESMTDSEASENAQAREDAMFKTVINRSSPSRAVTARVDRKPSDEVQDILDELEEILDELEGEEKDKLQDILDEFQGEEQDKLQDILDELEGEEQGKLRPSRQDGLLQGGNVVNGDAHEPLV
jgi:superfamily II helicase